MRFPVVLYLLFSIVLLAIGCRKPLAPNVDRNRAPETWITAAPQDTITIRPPDGAPSNHPATIAVRFHLYWAGSDEDGAVAGFYYAVTETIPFGAIPPGLPRPPLPGPKASDYRFTTRTDSTFIFRVSEFGSDRHHAFYVYAVDNQGKGDPTPARVMFNALDNFPPIPSIGPTDVKAIGTIYNLVNGQLTTSTKTVFVTDSLTEDNFAIASKDSVALGSRLEISWRGEPAIAGIDVSGFCYKLDEPRFICVPKETTSVVYPAGRLREGVKVFTLQVFDQAGGVREINRRFQMNYTPDTWFSGPDPSAFPPPDANGERYIDVSDWSTLPEVVGSLLSCDSITTLPVERPERRTFLEIYRDRIYFRQEFDTVHMNSWVILHNGGWDPDTPYAVESMDMDPVYPDTNGNAASPCTEPARALWPGSPNGSPIGFRQQRSRHLDFSLPNALSQPTPSGLYPVINSASSFVKPVIAGYEEEDESGQVYAVVRAQDGTGRIYGLDERIGDGRQAKGLVEAFNCDPNGSRLEKLRCKILTYRVNYPPRLLLTTGGFRPTPNFTYSSRLLTFNLLADDDDPLDPETPVNPGGPTLNKVLRWRVQVKGRTAPTPEAPEGFPLTYPAHADSQFTPQVQAINLPDNMIPTAGTPDTLLVELCDCTSCELSPGKGRCVRYNIPINFPCPGGSSPPCPILKQPASIGLATPTGTRGQPRPGASNREIRSKAP